MVAGLQALAATAIAAAALNASALAQTPADAEQPYELASAAYEEGDYVTAMRYWRALAEQGDAESQFNLGTMYYAGVGVTQDFAEAAKWYRRAAEQGLSVAQFNLGVMYDMGEGVLQNYVEAYKWLALAVASGGGGLESRDRLLGKMTPSQIAEAQKRAAEWKPKK